MSRQREIEAFYVIVNTVTGYFVAVRGDVVANSSVVFRSCSKFDTVRDAAYCIPKVKCI